MSPALILLAVRRANFYRAAWPHRPRHRPPLWWHLFARQRRPPNHPLSYGGRGFHRPRTRGRRWNASSDYTARRAEIAAWNAQSPILKRGIALTPVKFGISFTLTFLNQAGALVHVYQDGSIHLNHGGTEMGQGLNQKVAQVAAAVFGVDTSLIKITATDTGKVPNTSATAASSGSDLNGMAAKAACETIRDRMADFLAAKHQTRAETVTLCRWHGPRRKRRPTALPKSRKAPIRPASPCPPPGSTRRPKITWDRVKGAGRPFLYFAYGAAVTEVVIDTLTGENRILRADILHDTGTSLNPALDIGQIEGAYVQGAGWLTTEELVWDAKGHLTTHAPSTYKIPACSDRPPHLQRRPVGPTQPRRHRGQIQGRRRAALHAGHLGALCPVRCHRGLR